MTDAMTEQTKRSAAKGRAARSDTAKAGLSSPALRKPPVKQAGEKRGPGKLPTGKLLTGKTTTGKQTATPDKRRTKGAASSQRMIDAAIDLIAREGLANVTMQRIATEVGGSTALVVFHFRNMENLYQATLEHLGALYDELWQQYVEAPDLSAAQRLSGAVDCAQDFMQRYPEGVSVLIAFSSDRKSVQLYRKVALPGDRACLAIGRKLVDEIVAEGGYKGLDLDAISESINYLIFGSWMWDHVNPKTGRAPNLQTCALLLLERVFPKHFPLADR